MKNLAIHSVYYANNLSADITVSGPDPVNNPEAGNNFGTGSGLPGELENTTVDGEGYETGDNYALYNADASYDLSYKAYWDEPGLSENDGTTGSIIAGQNPSNSPGRKA